MKLELGSRLSHYGIVELIGKGGMGEVYRATDSRLPREVAIKTSTVSFSDRFALEAKVIASLNHPNICTLYDVGPNYLVMELIDGPTLAERIRSGPLGVNDASDIMRQVADALEYAHERGVVHRDLKPGNIKIRGDGVVKVLDFGLAKVAAEVATSATGAATAPITTAAGVVLGTTAYMSPEQVLGKPVDRRADVWAFGAVFYETLTGGRMHKGDTTQEVTASILRDEPDLTKVPPRARRLLKRCLEKDPNKRLRHIGDVMALLDDAPSGAQAAVAETVSVSVKRKWRWPAIAAAIASTAALMMWAPWRHTTGLGASEFTFEVPPAPGMTFNPGTAMTLSPSGEWMVFQAAGSDGVTRYWVRSSNGKELRPLPGTETIGATAPPAGWSFDSSSVIFAAPTETQLKSVNIRDGAPVDLADWPAGLNGVSENADGIILGGASTGGTPIYKVVKGRQERIPVTKLESRESNHLFPQFLPDGRHFLYLRVSPDVAKAGIYIGDINAMPDAQSMEPLLRTDRQGYYAANTGSKIGYLVFVRRDTLMAQRFDPLLLKFVDDAAVVIPGLDRIDSYEDRNFGIFSVSDNGMIAYRGDSGQQRVLQWYDEKGNPDKRVGEPALYSSPAISPLDDRIAVAIGSRSTRDIFVLDEHGTPSQFTFDPARDDYPTWSHDAKSVALSSDRNGQLDLYIGAINKPGKETLLLHTEEPKSFTHFTNDGQFVLFSNRGLSTLLDISVVRIAAEAKKSVSLVAIPRAQEHARVSPNGRWMAYTSGERGVLEIYVRPFLPDADQNDLIHWPVSKGGGTFPIWRPDGKALYYYTTQRSQLMVVDIDTTNDDVRANPPRPMFGVPSLTLQFGWDLSRDGKRFLFVADPNGQTIPFTVSTNWIARLKK